MDHMKINYDRELTYYTAEEFLYNDQYKLGKSIVWTSSVLNLLTKFLNYI